MNGNHIFRSVKTQTVQKNNKTLVKTEVIDESRAANKKMRKTKVIANYAKLKQFAVLQS
jgi:hypothetical protein